MNNLQWLSVNAEVILNRCRQRRAEHLAALAARLLSRRFTPASLMIWSLLSGASLLWVVLARQDGGHAATVMLAVWLAAVLSSIAGFAFSAIGGAILFHLRDDTVTIVQLMIICSIANQAAMTWASRRDIDWRGLAVYFAGGAPGLIVGVWMLLHVERMMYTYVFGAFLLTYGLYMVLRKPVVVSRQPAAVDFIAGLLGGVTGGAAGFPSAFVTIWCGMKGWNKVRQRAVTQPFILGMQIAGLLVINIAEGSHDGGTVPVFADLLFIPASLFGTALGLVLYQRLTDRQFARAVNLLLIVSGLSYVG